MKTLPPLNLAGENKNLIRILNDFMEHSRNQKIPEGVSGIRVTREGLVWVKKEEAAQ